MKVMFVVKSKAIECLGVMYLAAVVKQAGHEARIVDINEAEETVFTYQPKIIGYSVMTGDGNKFQELNRKLKKQGKFTSIFGGSDPTFFPEPYEQDDDINMICKGEGENFMADVLGSANRYPNIDSIPWPDRADFAHMKIRDFLASRGCQSACSYCYNASFNAMFPEIARVRTRNYKDVVSEVEAVYPKFVYFQDSNFGAKISWMREFSKEYRRRVNLPYHCHLRPNLVNEERGLLLHDSNCVSVKCALETASDRLRKLINRGNSSNEDVYTAARHLKKWGIALCVQNILGLPESTIEDDLGTLEVNIKAKPQYAWCSIFTPYPKTVLADYCEAKGIYTGNYAEIGDNFFDKSFLNFTPEHKEQIETLQKIFALCVEHQVMPKVEDLTWERMPKFAHEVLRKVGDKRMFPGIF